MINLFILIFGIILIIFTLFSFIQYSNRYLRPPPADPNGVNVPLTFGLPLDRDDKFAKQGYIKHHNLWYEIFFSSDYAIPNPPKIEKRSILLPSPEYIKKMKVECKRKKNILNELWKKDIGQKNKNIFENKWELLNDEKRKKLIIQLKSEMLLAVASYIGRDMPLLDVICPELNVNTLLNFHKGKSEIVYLVDSILYDKKKNKKNIKNVLTDPNEIFYNQVKKAINKISRLHYNDKDSLYQLSNFLTYFRQLCILSFCIQFMNDFSSEWNGDISLRDSTTKNRKKSWGVTFLASTIKTGGSALVMTLLFYALNQFIRGYLT